MSTKKSKSFNQLYLHKKYYGHIFLMPPTPYVDFLKKIYDKYRNTNAPRNLLELKKLALEEAKKKTNNIPCRKSKTKTERGEAIIQKDDVIKLFKALYTIIDPIMLKLNQTYKNERRKYYNNNEKYLDSIKSYIDQRSNIVLYTVKSICKLKKIKYTTLQTSVFHYLNNEDSDIYEIINSFTKAGKNFTIAPKRLEYSDILDILKFYNDNLNYIIQYHKGSEMIKYSLIFINDLIYENFGLEEDQVFAFINENENLVNTNDISYYVSMIRQTIIDNLTNLFHE
jgi:hypothetical protein